jgi:hypothetical protein
VSAAGHPRVSAARGDDLRRCEHALFEQALEDEEAAALELLFAVGMVEGAVAAEELNRLAGRQRRREGAQVLRLIGDMGKAAHVEPLSQSASAAAPDRSCALATAIDYFAGIMGQGAKVRQHEETRR